MYYPQIEDNNNTRSNIDTFLGLNHNYKVNQGEFYDMENLSTDGFPVMTVRDLRTTLIALPEVETEDGWKFESQFYGCLYTGGDLAYLTDKIFHYGAFDIDITEIIPEPQKQKLIRFGNYILMFPSQTYIDLTKHTAGKMGSKYNVAPNTTITYSLCDYEGEDYQNVTKSATAPTNPQTGAYWLCTAEGKKGLYVYYNNSWEAVATTYIRVSIPGSNLKDYFEDQDVVFLNSNVVKDINDGSQIQKVEDDSIIVIGLIEDTVTERTSEAWTLTIERRIPKLDYVCVSKNRVWGCRYGYNDGDPDTLYNEIYCSKLGDFKNWNTFQGISTDSYAVTIGHPGEWTGCISYQGYPTFFKEDMMYRIFGSYPAEFQLSEKECRGVQLGSSESLAIVGEYLYYKACGGVMVYDGSTPTMISGAFGRDIYYYDGMAGALGNKYFLQVTNELNKVFIYVYDSQYGIWTKESQFNEYRKSGLITNNSAIAFTYTPDGKLFAMTNHAVLGIGQKDDALYEAKVKGGEDFVKWYAETGDIGFEYPDYKYMSKVTVRVFLPYIAELQMEVSYDDRPFEYVGKLRGNNNTMTQILSLYPNRCDHFRLRFSGHGAARIYNIALTMDVESDEHGY